MPTPPASELLPEQGPSVLSEGVVVGNASGRHTALTPATKTAFQRRLDQAPEWFCDFLAGNTREKTRFRSELSTMKGSVVWLVRQRRLGAWTTTEREHLRSVMRSASSVSPYLLIWVVPGSLLVLPFMAWFIDRRRRDKSPLIADAPATVQPDQQAP